jgi:hypothetical protein
MDMYRDLGSIQRTKQHYRVKSEARIGRLGTSGRHSFVIHPGLVSTMHKAQKVD